ncbi:MAG: recombinase zinc ribbon domain-containing protein [Streptosporangiaceae bacterium]
MRCPACGKAMIGTRAHGRSHVYRYYTCFTRARYDTSRCSAARLDADAVEHAVTTALAGFYHDQHHLIADAVTQAQASHAAGQDGWRAELTAAELTAAEHELARTSAAIDPYLTAFENGTLDPEDLAGRLAQLTTRSAQLRARRETTRQPGRRIPLPRRQPPPCGRSPTTSPTSSQLAVTASARR